MIRLGRASAPSRSLRRRLRVLMLIDGQLTDFNVSAGVWAGALIGVALFEYVFNATHAEFGLTSRSGIKTTRYTPIRP